MAKKYSGGIGIATGFKLSDPQPIADYMVVELLSDLTNTTTLPNQFIGMITYVTEDNNLWLKKDIGWVKLGGNDVFVTGGTLTSGTTVFRNNTGGTFSVTGFTTDDNVVHKTFAESIVGVKTFSADTIHYSDILMKPSSWLITDVGSRVGINRVPNNPDSAAKLQVAGPIFTDNGGIEFATSNLTRNVITQGGNDILRLRNYNTGEPSTVFDISARPGIPIIDTREATLSLSRSDDGTNAEFLDFYNNGYFTGPSPEVQYGIRIQKRGVGLYRPFVFDWYDGTTKDLGFTAEQSTGFTFSKPVEVKHLKIKNLSGGTSVNNLGIDANGNVVTSSGNSGVDIFVTGGTFNPSGGTATFKNNAGSTFDVTGFQGLFVADIPVVLNAGDSLGKYHNGDIIPTKGKTIEWIMNDIATDFIPPTFSVFTRGNYSPTILDLGDVMPTGSQSFTWATTTPNNISATTLTLTSNISSTIIGTGLNYLGGTANYTTPDVIISNTPIENKVIYTIAGINNRGNVFNRTLTASWRHRFFYGKSVATDLTTPANVTGLTSSALVVGVTSTYVNVGASVGNYVYLVVPASIPQPTDFRDSVAGCFGNNIPFTNLGTIAITRFGVTTTYNKYRSINTIDGAISIWMCS